MAASPNYASIPVSFAAQVSAANPNRDGTGTLVTVATGATAGTRIDDISIQAVGTTTSGMIRLYVSLDGGTTNRLWKEVPVSAVTPSGSAKAWSTTLSDLALTLANSSAILRASTHNAEAFNIVVTRAGNF